MRRLNRILVAGLVFLVGVLIGRASARIELPRVRIDLRENGYYIYRLPVIANFPEPRNLRKGGAFETRMSHQCEDADLLNVSWYYDWSAIPPICNDVESAPMLWGRWSVGAEIGGNSEWLLGFNEPDFCDQSNIPIDEAIPLWEKIESEYSDKKLVSPVMGQGGLNENPNQCGVVGMWLPQFRERFREVVGRDPRFDAIAFHCYILNDDWLADCKRRLAQHIQWSEDWDTEGVWVTEYGFVPNAPVPNPYGTSKAIRRESEWIVWLQTQPRVLRYAHFVNRWNDAWGGDWVGGYEKFMLIDRNNKLTPFGVMYRGF